ncbi:alcohol dehydrogenase zinc-binding domain-containing protein [Syncephalis plumigaleata]|nr:alcohol dehydrogenase zinc-binding domain-containing protein [Syncephalis plumigaleata]
MSETMKAIQIQQNGGPEVLKYATVPRPTVSAGQLLVRNHTAGVNFIDTYHRSGLYKLPLPTILGREGAGEVIAVGEGVEGFKTGDRVAYIGGTSYSEYAAVPAITTAQLPENVSWNTAAAALLQGLTAWSMVTLAYPVKAGDWILVHAAAGGTGRWLVRLCKRAGAHVIGTVSTEEKAALAREDGADVVLNYSPLPGEADDATVDERLLCDIMTATKGQGVHAALDGVGKRTFDLSLNSLRRLGTLITFGNASGPVPPVDVLRLAKGNYKLMRTTLFQYITTKEEFASLAVPMFSAIANGELKVPICAEFPLEGAAEAHKYLEGRKSTGKIILTIN